MENNEAAGARGIGAAWRSMSPSSNWLTLWLALLVSFVLYGFIGGGDWSYGHSFDPRGAANGALFFGALGAGIAICLTADVWTVCRVIDRRITRFDGLRRLVAASVVGTFLTPLIRIFERATLPQELVEGGGCMSFLGEIYGIMLVAVVALSCLLLFTLVVLVVRQKPPFDDARRNESAKVSQESPGQQS
jgi:hypothetical protein